MNKAAKSAALNSGTEAKVRVGHPEHNHRVWLWFRFMTRGAPLLLLGVLACLGVLLVPLAHATTGASLVVNTTTDEDTNGNSLCSLREAITAANNNANYHDCTGTGYGADTITFSVTGTITLGSLLPAINDDVTIDGSGQAIIVDGNHAVRGFWVNGGKTLDLASLRIVNGEGGFDCGEYCGGGIVNSGTLNVTNVTFSNNNALHDGGAIFNGGLLTVTNSTFDQNSAGGGGAIRNNGTVNVTNSTFSNNYAGDGAGILNFDYGAVLTVTNSTFYHNDSTYIGGGITNYGGTAHVTNSTFADNSATTSGGGFENFAGTATLYNTIIANSASGGDCANGGTLTANSYNFDTDGSCDGATTKTNAEINLGALQDNGGPTKTMALGTGSAAIDAGNDTTCSNPVGSPNYGAGGFDQRGVPRPAVDCDSGAYEVESAQAGPSFVVTHTADTDSGICGVVYCTLRQAINAANAHSGTDTITFNIPASDGGCTAANVCTITLGGELPIIDDDLTIDGAANAAQITVNGNNKDRVMYVSANVSIDTLTIANGECDCNGAGIFSGGDNSTLTVTNSTFTGNTLVNGGSGAAIYSAANNGTVRVTNSTFSGNGFVDCTGPCSRDGGAIAISSGGTLTVTNSTFSGNNADQGSAIYNDYSTITLRNSILANNTGGGNCYIFNGDSGTITADSSNLADDSTCDNATTKTAAEINLGDLADNGGPTQTMAIPTNSAAIDAGDSSVCSAAVGSPDYGAGGLGQRGEPRPDGRCDVGAFERQVGYLTVIKHVDNSQGGSASAANWTMNVSGVNPTKTAFAGAEVPGVRVILDPGAYSVTESGGPAGYKDTYSADCSGTLAAGDINSCTITNAQFTPTPTMTPTLTPTITPTPTATATATPTGISCFESRPVLIAPTNGAHVAGESVSLDWQDDPCATKYKLRVKLNSKRGPVVAKKNNLTVSDYNLSLFPSGYNQHLWRIKACNATLCSKWSAWWTFKFVPQ